MASQEAVQEGEEGGGAETHGEGERIDGEGGGRVKMMGREIGDKSGDAVCMCQWREQKEQRGKGCINLVDQLPCMT